MNEASLLPYKTIKDLPENVRNVLPEHAQHISPVAWAAVKKEYRKDESGLKWVSI